jgi:hypothetical protein
MTKEETLAFRHKNAEKRLMEVEKKIEKYLDTAWGPRLALATHPEEIKAIKEAISVIPACVAKEFFCDKIRQRETIIYPGGE